MEKKTKQIIGVCCVIYSLCIFVIGFYDASIFVQFGLIGMFLFGPLVTISFLIVGLLLIFEKKE